MDIPLSVNFPKRLTPVEINVQETNNLATLRNLVKLLSFQGIRTVPEVGKPNNRQHYQKLTLPLAQEMEKTANEEKELRETNDSLIRMKKEEQGERNERETRSRPREPQFSHLQPQKPQDRCSYNHKVSSQGHAMSNNTTNHSNKIF